MPDKPDSAAPVRREPRPWAGWTLFVIIMLTVFVLGVLGASILERRQEAKAARPLVSLAVGETDPSTWGQNWPREHASYKKMQNDTSRTKYGGAEPRDLLAETPANVILFAGYAFAKEYRQARGHVYAVQDVTTTKRRSPATVATCWTCKSPDVPRLMSQFGEKKLGDKAAAASFEEKVLAGAGEFYAHKFDDFKDEVKHPIACLDCHDPATMRLRISRPALREAFTRQGKDIDQVSHQEMRTLVCAQCHVEYYFQPKTNYLTFPWDKGTGVEDMERYYQEKVPGGFSDWTHAISGAPMLKMQHPDYEVYTKGIHAYRNVACADCHMPYRTEGGSKFSDHHLQSPLLNIANSCAVCHRWGEEEIKSRVESIQDKVAQARQHAERALALAHLDIAACQQAGASAEELAPLRQQVRQAQMRWDYVAANNGMGFHAPQECTRILGDATDLAQECRVGAARLLAQRGHTQPVRYPAFDTKDKAQALIKLFIDGRAPDLLGRAVAATQPTAALP